MAKQNTKSKKGFTIIEVVLVLAIAGLIFLMVFIALPALQRSQRDTQRRDDMSRFMSQLSQYQSNNAGNVPKSKEDFTSFISNYLSIGDDKFVDPLNGEAYIIGGYIDCSKEDCKNKSTSDNIGQIFVYSNAKCDGEDVEKNVGARRVAITTKLEGAGVYCSNN